MITYLKIHGFKSFHEFEMEFTPFTVIAGANASGKSNLFDALKLLSRLAESDNLKKAFKEQRGEFMELFTQYSEQEHATQMEFGVEMLVDRRVKDAWGSEASLKYTRLKYELKIRRFTNTSGIEDLEVFHEELKKLNHAEDKWIKIIPPEYRENWRPKVKVGKRGTPYMLTAEENNIPTVLVPQDGTTGNKRRFPLNNASRTVLSSFDTIDFPHVLAAKEEMKSWRFLEFSPHDLRQPTNKNTGEDEISETGGNLAAVLYRIKQEDPYLLKDISRKLQSFLPEFSEVDVIDDRENKQFVIKLKDKDKKEYSSRVLSEGTLRILALCILEHDDKHTGLLCFEEPENGIHPFRIESMARLLQGLSIDFSSSHLPLRQVIVNTHSPVLLKKVHDWNQNEYISIWYASMRNQISDIQGNRTKMTVTSILPVVENKNQLSLSFSEQDKKLTLFTIQKYLETTPQTTY